MDDNAIRIEHVSKTYHGSLIPAVNDISLDIPSGSKFGLLGPNGAGKTTTISILTGLLNYDSGHVYINDMRLEKKYKKIRQLIGLVPQDIALYETLSARENLRFIAEMYGLKGKQAKQRIEECLEVVGLASNGHKQIRKYSGGMKRRINLVAGILHHPEILILLNKEHRKPGFIHFTECTVLDQSHHKDQHHRHQENDSQATQIP